MATPAKPWKAEYAKSSRSSCKTCKIPIDKEKLRLGKMVQATQFDGLMPMWNHATCIMETGNQIKSFEDVEGIDSLRWEDQQKIKKYIENGVSSPTRTSVTANEYGIEVSQTSRATCKSCNQKIIKGEVRISYKPEGQGARGLTWHHASCFMESSPCTQVEELSGWGSLSVSDQVATKDISATKNGGSKRKSGANGGQMSKILKTVTVEDEAAKENSTKYGTTQLPEMLVVGANGLEANKHDMSYMLNAIRQLNCNVTAFQQQIKERFDKIEMRIDDIMEHVGIKRTQVPHIHTHTEEMEDEEELL